MTSQLMRMYALGEAATRPFVRNSLRAKVGYLLRLRGFRSTRKVTVKWVPDTGLESGVAKKIVMRTLQEGVKNEHARQYWGTRLQWTAGKKRTVAEGGKNMRRMAQLFDMSKQRARTPKQRWQDRRRCEVRLVERNVHVPRADLHLHLRGAQQGRSIGLVSRFHLHHNATLG